MCWSTLKNKEIATNMCVERIKNNGSTKYKGIYQLNGH